MINFKSIDVKTFLREYWQKKPLVIRQAINNFTNILSPDELAGLAMEEDVESRIVFEKTNKNPSWELKRGPFSEKDFAKLPKTHWTLLVQSVDKLIPEFASLLDDFDFIPQWRMDDLMISYAVKHGSVGPHYDNYDVFLYQASGSRKWSLTSKNCNESNYVKDLELRIMDEFAVEEEYILAPGDMLYLPPHIGHHGISLDDDCMTYSFGYRSYEASELWDSFGDYRSMHNKLKKLYVDPNWDSIKETSAISPNAWLQAKMLMQDLLADESNLKSWFGSFATRVDEQSDLHMPLPLDESEIDDLDIFIQNLTKSKGLMRDLTCRFAYIDLADNKIQLFINGCEWNTEDVANLLCELVANQRNIEINSLMPFLDNNDNQLFLYELWKLQWLHIVD